GAGLGCVSSAASDEAGASPRRRGDAGAGHPTTAVDVARDTFDRWYDKPWHQVLGPFAQGEVSVPDTTRARWDRAYAETAGELDRQFAPRFRAARHEALGTGGHGYLRQAQPEQFGAPRQSASGPP